MSQRLIPENSAEYEVVVNSLLDVIESVELFRGIKYKELFAIIKDLRQYKLKKGDVIFNEGSYGKKIYIILEGQVGLYLGRNAPHSSHANSKSELLGREPAFSYLSKGEAIGQFSVLVDLPKPLRAKVESEGTELISFEIDYESEKNFPNAFKQIYKNALQKHIESIMKLKEYSKQNEKIIQIYLSNMY